MTDHEWTDAEREALTTIQCGTYQAAHDARADLARLVAARKAQAAARAWDEGYDAASTMARCHGHTDHWAEGEEPSNPYERGNPAPEWQFAIHTRYGIEHHHQADEHRAGPSCPCEPRIQWLGRSDR